MQEHKAPLDASAKLKVQLEPLAWGRVLGALAVTQSSLAGPRAELLQRELTEITRDIREQLAEQ